MKNVAESYRLKDIYFYYELWRNVKQVHYIYAAECSELLKYLPTRKITQVKQRFKDYRETKFEPAFRLALLQQEIWIDHIIQGETPFSLWRILQLLEMIQMWRVEHNLKNPKLLPQDKIQLQHLIQWKRWQLQFILEINEIMRPIFQQQVEQKKEELLQNPTHI